MFHSRMMTWHRLMPCIIRSPVVVTSRQVWSGRAAEHCLRRFISDPSRDQRQRRKSCVSPAPFFCANRHTADWLVSNVCFHAKGSLLQAKGDTVSGVYFTAAWAPIVSFFCQTATAVGTRSSRSIVFLPQRFLTLRNATFSTTVESLLVAMTSKDIQQALEICFFCKKQSVGYLFHRAPYWFFPLFVFGRGEGGGEGANWILIVYV